MGVGMTASFCAKYFYSSLSSLSSTLNSTSFRMSCFSRSSVSQIRRVAMRGICTFSLHKIAFNRSCVLSAKNVVAIYRQPASPSLTLLSNRALRSDTPAVRLRYTGGSASDRGLTSQPLAMVSTESRLS